MGFPLSGFKYDVSAARRAFVYTDPVKLNQVVYNLLINSIKYSEADPSLFQIWINVDEDQGSFIVKFKDWGIGISEKYKDEVLKLGFRTPEAINRNVTGSGLGLEISKSIMEELGGELKLIGFSKPTEFHMVIPKSIENT
jgi:signal transduction histidine kinase